MIEKILCNYCYHSIIEQGKAYCNYYDKYVARKECSKYDYEMYKWFGQQDTVINKKEVKKTVRNKKTKKNFKRLTNKTNKK